MVQGSSVVEQSLGEWRRSNPNGLQVALLVGNECVRQGLAAMLSSLAIVDRVHVWDSASRIFTSPDQGFDILILRFGDLDAGTTDQLARETWRRSKKILILLGRDHEDWLDTITAIPSNGFLVQDELTSSSLAATISRVTAGDTPMPPMLANRLLSRAREGAWKPAPTGANLTPRERQVLELLVEGLSNKEIARRLRISQHGVKRLVSNVLAKLNCPNRTQAVAVALTDGILTGS
jgi:two-component system nitrate/nitrite response regulator NarL